MSNLTDEFIEWVLSEYHIKLSGISNNNTDAFKKLLPDLEAMLKSNEEQNNDNK